MMFLFDLFKKFTDKYMKSTTERLDFPEFPEDEEKRYEMIFSGVVQGVGFRYEAYMIAEKLGLSGYAANLPNGDVLVEVQGSENKIQYFVQCLQSIPRITIEQLKKQEMDVKEECGFQPLY